jgi:hypothetical protein
MIRVLVRVVIHAPRLSGETAKEGRSMRMLIIAAIALGTLIVTMAESSNNAQAVVCARGVYRAGCAGPNGAVVAHRPAVARHGVVCRRYGIVGGVRRCVLY